MATEIRTYVAAAISLQAMIASAWHSGSSGPGGGSIPWVVWLLIAVVFLAVWGLLSLTR